MQTLLVCWVALSFGLGAVWALLATRLKQVERRARTAAPAAAPPRTASPAVTPARAGVLRLVEDDAPENFKRRGAGTRTRVPTTAR